MKTKKIKTEKSETKKVKLHIGCGTTYLKGWTNIDNLSSNRISILDLNWDLTKSLPYEDNSVDLIYDKHFFKKMEMGDKMVESALWNYRCMLKPEGVLRIETPEAQFVQQLEPWLNMLGFPHVEFSWPKPVLNYIEFHVTEHCNLNCKGCGHFCPLAEPEFADIKQYKKDFKRLSELFSNIREIRILGGEPLLHKNINDFFKVTRENFPTSRISLVTNGILLPKMEQKFWDTLNKYSIEINMTQYPTLETFKVKAEELAAKNNIRLYFSKVTQFWKGLNLNGYGPKESMFASCKGKICHFLKKGTMSVCGMPHHLEHFNKKFNRNVPMDGIIDIHSPNITGEDIIKHFNTPFETCRYCKPDCTSFDWDTSSCKEEEWRIDQGDILIK